MPLSRRHNANNTFIFAALFAAICAISPVAHSAQLYGEASCKASKRGACPDINDISIFARVSGSIVYYAPDGVVYNTESITIRRGKWWVDASGHNYIVKYPWAGQLSAAPINRNFAASDIRKGDVAGISKGRSGFYIVPYSKEPFSKIIKDVRAGRK